MVRKSGESDGIKYRLADELREREISGEMLEEYNEGVKDVLGSIDGNSRKYMKQVFDNPATVIAYDILRRDGYTSEEAVDLIKYGAIQLNRDEDGKISREINETGLYQAIGDAVKRAGGHTTAVKALKRSEYISGEEAAKVNKRIRERVRGHLERLVAVWIFIGVGAIMMLLSVNSLIQLTGAVVGVSETLRPATFFVGLAIFIVGLILSFRRTVSE